MSLTAVEKNNLKEKARLEKERREKLKQLTINNPELSKLEKTLFESQSISVLSSEKDLVEQLRYSSADPQNKFIANKSEIYRAGIQVLAKLSVEEIREVIKTLRD